MKSADIREKFLRFFETRGHFRADSSPLTPDNDPTLLFTNSGMVQFKDVFLGFDKRPYDTAATAQRCLRAGGKHNDLQNVGYTSRHHTFFEMLGNFSFGQYFKERAIPLAWEFLTSPPDKGGLGLDKQHLWITVFGGGKLFGDNAPAVPPDSEARRIWTATLCAAGFSAEEAHKRIVDVPTADNFWMMGEAGPCGPCSEIFYDPDENAERFRGEEEECADECVEIWNLVFMEFNRDDAGTLHKLPAPCVDTGMGLERISAVMQQVKGNYEIDMFQQLLAKADRRIAEAGGKSCNGDYEPSHRVVADHIRAAAYLIADGVLPDNEGRGYVLRKIIRRALIHGCKAGQKPDLGKKPWFGKLSLDLPEVMGKAADVLRDNAQEIERTLEREEQGFFKSYLQGLSHLLNKISEQTKPNQKDKKALFSGEAAFELYDTYGFPVEATADEVMEHGFAGVDMTAFDKCMREQRERSRAAAKFNIKQTAVSYDGAATEFYGYEQLTGEAKVVSLFVDGEPVKEVRPGKEALMVLDRTPFYAESGGQVGDTGTIQKNGVALAVQDTQKIRADVWGHSVMVAESSNDALCAGDVVSCRVDASRRAEISGNHSATHLMHAALRQVLGTHVRQKGSLVAPDHLRFDFSHDSAVSDQELQRVEEIVNAQVRANDEVQIELLKYDDAIARGAMALFGEKYGDVVRMVSIDADFSTELCGGAHVGRAGDIGFFMFVRESAIAAGVRRVEAVCGKRALAKAQNNARQLLQIAAALKSPPEKIFDKIEQTRAALKESQKQLLSLQQAQTAAQTGALAQHSDDINGVRVLAAKVDNADLKTLRETAAKLKGELSPCAVLLAGNDGGVAVFVCAADVKGIDAGKWIRRVAETADAKGGGKPDYAQAGGGNAAKIDKALEVAKESVREMLNASA